LSESGPERFNYCFKASNVKKADSVNKPISSLIHTARNQLANTLQGVFNAAAMPERPRLFHTPRVGTPAQKKSPGVIGIFLLFAIVVLAGCRPEAQPVSGTIEVDEAHVASRYGGRVEKLYANEGDALKQGAPIADLDASELHAQRDLMVAQIDTARHDLEAQMAQLEFLKADTIRQQELLIKKVVSPNDAERSASAAKAQEKTIEASEKRITQARAQLAQTDAQLSEMRVAAPSDCVLEVLSVKVGDVLPANREVATVLLPQHLWVRVYVTEDRLGFLKLGQQVRIRVDSFKNKDFSGVVEQINRQAEFTPRNVQTVGDRIRQVFGVKIRLNNEEDQLRAGMSADAYFSQAAK
jgi:HlyD family secretion protein